MHGTPQGRGRSRDDDDTAVDELDISSDDNDFEDDDDRLDEDEDRGDDHEPTPDDDDDADEDEGDDPDTEALRQIGEEDMVPRARLNEVLERLRVLEEQGRKPPEPKPEAPPEPEFDLKAKTKERNERLLEGDIDGASEIDAEIANYHQQSAAKAAAQHVQQALGQERVTNAIAEIQRDYPALNDKGKGFDPNALKRVIWMRNGLMSEGLNMAEALRAAAEEVCGKPDRGDEPAPRRTQRQLSLQQKKAAVQRARRTPPPTGRSGASGRPSISVDDLSEDAIKRMPERRFRDLDPKEKARLRGDIVEKKKS